MMKVENDHDSVIHSLMGTSSWHGSRVCNGKRLHLKYYRCINIFPWLGVTTQDYGQNNPNVSTTLHIEWNWNKKKCMHVICIQKIQAVNKYDQVYLKEKSQDQ